MSSLHEAVEGSGVTFERFVDGSVAVRYARVSLYPMVIMTPEQWASVVAGVSSVGDVDVARRYALDFHMRPVTT